MLMINGEKAKILETYFKISKKSFNEGYYGNLSVSFQLHNKEGYFQFFVDSPKNDDFNYYVNKTYKCVPDFDKNNINDIEIYDTNEFFDYLDNEMILSFGNIENNKIQVSILINEKYILIEFNDKINLIFE